MKPDLTGLPVVVHCDQLQNAKVAAASVRVWPPPT